jgi:hypothetical protein
MDGIVADEAKDEDSAALVELDGIQRAVIARRHARTVGADDAAESQQRAPDSSV